MATPAGETERLGPRDVHAGKRGATVVRGVMAGTHDVTVEMCAATGPPPGLSRGLCVRAELPCVRGLFGAGTRRRGHTKKPVQRPFITLADGSTKVRRFDASIGGGTIGNNLWLPPAFSRFENIMSA